MPRVWVLGVFILSTAGAQAPLVITYDEAVAIALERNVLLQQARIGAALDDVAVSDARMQFAPSLGMSVSGSQSYGRYFNETEGRIVEQTTESASVGISSGVGLFSGFRDVANLKRAKLDRQAGALDLNRTQETVVFTVASNFLSLVQRREQLRVQRENLAAESKLEQQLQQYVEAGARPAADLYQQQANLSAARLAVVEAESAAELAQVDLMRTLQLDPAGVYEFQPPAGPQNSADEALNLEQLLAHAIAERADLKAMQTRLSSAEQSVRIAHSGYWPQLSLSAGYGSAYTTASALDLNDQLDLQRGGSVGVGLSIPVFDRKGTRNASRRAHLQVLSARVAYDSARQEVGLQVRRAYLDYRSARERFTAAEAQQRAADRAVRTAQERFKAGVATLVELSQAQAGFVQAESALANARSSLAFQRTVIEYYAGNLAARPTPH